MRSRQSVCSCYMLNSVVFFLSLPSAILWCWLSARMPMWKWRHMWSTDRWLHLSSWGFRIILWRWLVPGHFVTCCSLSNFFCVVQSCCFIDWSLSIKAVYEICLYQWVVDAWSLCTMVCDQLVLSCHNSPWHPPPSPTNCSGTESQVDYNVEFEQFQLDFNWNFFWSHYEAIRLSY